MAERPGTTYEILDHTADVMIRVFGDSRDALFRHALQGLYAVLGTFQTRAGDEAYALSLAAPSCEDLLHDWLAEALFCAQTRCRLYRDTAFSRLTDTELRADILLAAIDPERTVYHQEIKAVTYHELRVKREEDLWVASVVLDL